MYPITTTQANLSLKMYSGNQGPVPQPDTSVWPSVTVADKVSPLFPRGSALAGTHSTDVKDITVFVFSGAQRTASTPMRSISIKDVSNFFKEIKELKWSLDPDRQQDLCNTAGFLLMNTFRLIRKDAESLQNHIINTARNSLISLYGFTIDSILPPPHNNYYDTFNQHFSSSFPRTKYILSVFIQAWVEHKSREGYLKAGCLLSLCENGLGVY
ncbi:hypothetical protein J6590_069459 [Homalodisca vitripennis]|nr:hypothetical protein J6590_069459 [Homalodisca vitripennis]